ncbi:Putative transcriptional regulator, ArsR family [Desulfonema limicola]|uniref:Transcriptional regulator, ArsR family n=1 Tax=Desulfonema limicola TaxID=45656 RepID=A0A975GFW7_9BACT|nr:Putative transcriptional regulator, ArsR family [Desulfonema limicola]
MKEFVKVMKALSDPNRVKILKMLQHKTMCVCEIQKALEISQPTVSKHLKTLENAGLVSFYKDGLWVNYHIDTKTSSPFAASLLSSLKHWLEDDPGIADVKKKLPFIRREDLCRIEAQTKTGNRKYCNGNLKSGRKNVSGLLCSKK